MTARIDIDPINRATRGFVLFFRGLFASGVVPDKWRWRPTDSKIHITTAWPVETEKLEGRPILVIHHNGARFGGVGLADNVAHGLLESSGQETQDIIQSSMLIHCIAKSGGTANAISWYVTKYLRLHVEELAKRTNLLQISKRSIIMGVPAPAAEYLGGSGGDSWMRVPVSANFTAPEHSEPTVDTETDFQIVNQQVRMQFDVEYGPAPPQPSGSENLTEAIGQRSVTGTPLTIDGISVVVNRKRDPRIARKAARVESFLAAQGS